MLWVKAFHIVFMVTWFAGLFYLPRLFIYHRAAVDQTSHDRFVVMERRLFIIMTIGAVLTAVFGIWLILLNPGLLNTDWIQVKLVLVLVLISYHAWCRKISLDLKNGTNPHSDKWLRYFNEVPSVLLITIVILAVVKPF
jgi:putative membrane protein